MKDARAIIAFPTFLSSISARRALRVRSLPANLITLPLQFEQRREKKERFPPLHARTERRTAERFTHVCCTRACTHTHVRTRGRDYTPAGPCLYGTFSGSQAAVGTINDNPSLSLSLARCVLVGFNVGADRPPLSLSPSLSVVPPRYLFLSLSLPFSLPRIREEEGETRKNRRRTTRRDEGRERHSAPSQSR